ncbi:MAG TPA: glutathione S-transferase family protein [Polyangiaceae bacterium]|nr:glutathione S-transferase family protein [Polyangiaceae bacterium]
MALVFYYAPMTSATRIHWALEELGMPYEKVKLDLADGEHKRPEYLALNPNGKVPLVVDDGTPVFESVAILIHLGQKYGVERGLWPAPNTPEHARALAWAVWSAASLSAAIFRLFLNTSSRVPEETRNAAQAELARVEATSLLGVLETELEGHDYLLGGPFSFVDLANASAVAFLARTGYDLIPFPRVAAWLGRCTNRPALAVATAG